MNELYCETHGMLLYGADVREHSTPTRCEVKNVDIPKADVALFALPVLSKRRGWDLVKFPGGFYEWCVL